MEDLERRVIQLEEKLKSELGDDGEEGAIWRCISSHGSRLNQLDDKIWKGNGDSLSTQIVKLRTELRTLAAALVVLMPLAMKLLDMWMTSIH
jgi:hypothetical protein